MDGEDGVPVVLEGPGGGEGRSARALRRRLGCRKAKGGLRVEAVGRVVSRGLRMAPAGRMAWCGPADEEVTVVRQHEEVPPGSELQRGINKGRGKAAGAAL